MVLNASHIAGDTGHVADHNVIAAYVNTHDDVDAATTAHHHTLGTGANQASAGNHTHSPNPALEGTTAPPNTNTTGGVLGTASTAAHSDHTHAVGAHDHSTTAKGGTLAQSAITKTVRIGHTWAISGTLGVQSGATNYIPPFYVPVPAGQTATIAAIRAKARAGSVTAQVTKNGTSVTGLSAVSVTTTATTTSATGGNTCSDGDEIALVLSSPSSADGLTVTVYVDITV